MSASMKEADVRAWIISHIAEYLAISTTEILPDREFTAFGLDSVDVIIIGGAFEEQFNVEIDATVFLRNPTIDAFVSDLRRSGLIV
jgi:acyl carrier protein